MHIKTRIIRPEPKMRVLPSLSLALLMSVSAVATVAPAAAQAYTSVEFSVGFAPPPLPVYDQPPIPGYGYIWIPGYWSWDDDQGQYYWVDGRWVRPPHAGYLWTPGYWDYDGDQYVFIDGYWGPQVGYYGGINYGYGYGGYGYDGGYWNNDRFYYNRWANNFGGHDFDEVYERRWDNDHDRDHDHDRRSWSDHHDGGQGWARGNDHRFDDHNRNGATIQGQQGWNRGGAGGVVVRPQQGWTRGASGVVVRPEPGQFNGRQPYPPANGGGFDRSGQHPHNTGVAPVTAPNIWRGADRGAPATPQTYGGPRQTYAPQAGFTGRPQGFQGQPPPRQTFVAPPQMQRQAHPAERPAQPAQPRVEGRRRDDGRQ